MLWLDLKDLTESNSEDARSQVFMEEIAIRLVSAQKSGQIEICPFALFSLREFYFISTIFPLPLNCPASRW